MIPRGDAVAVAERPATTGIGHTRWATHGRVSEENAHPHSDSADRVHVVVNGIVENYIALKERLQADGSEFTSETDAEVIAHLIADLYEGDLGEAVRAAYGELEGHYAFVAMSLDEPEVLVGARKECPLIVGRGEGEQFVASAVPGFLAETRRVQYLENGEIAVLRPEGVQIMDRRRQDGRARARSSSTGTRRPPRRRGYETFMLKEIHEQADAVADAIADRTARRDGVDLAGGGRVRRVAARRACERIVIVACGTSYHAGLIGRYAIEEWARVPVEMDIASEYRYRNPVVGARRPRGRHLAVGRDGRHARRDAPRARARGARARGHQRDGLGGHARRPTA